MGKNILLLTPPYHTGIIEISGNWPPLHLVCLAGDLRKAGHRVEIYDAMTENHSLEETKLQVLAKNPDIVMIGAYTPSVNCALDLLGMLKKDNPRVITCLGGVHATFCYNDILGTCNSFVDYIIRGEGERTSVELVNALENNCDLTKVPGLAFYREGRVVATPERELIADLDELTPAWDLLAWEDYYFKITGRRLAVVFSSRGCNYRCKFCSQHLFWEGTYRERKAENFVAEIEYLHQTYGVGMFMLADEYATKNRGRWERILDLLIAKGLDVHLTLETRVDDIVRDEDIIDKYARAGIIHVYIGVESVDQQVLEDYQKQLNVAQSKKALDLLNNAGIITECSFIMGGPDETAASMDRTLKTAIEFNPDLAHFLLITPWPYADIYRELEPYVAERDYSKYHFVHPVVKPKAMELKEVWEKLIDCFRVFYRGKAQKYLCAPEGLKKQYMLKAIQIMHSEFFATNFGREVIKIPAGMEPTPSEIDGYDLSKKGDSEMTEKLATVTKEELDKEILDFIERGIDYADEGRFNELALKQFLYQYQENDFYRNLCRSQGINPDQVTNWWQIPAVPTEAFKKSIIASFPLSETELSLLTSGTTSPETRGKIYRDKSSLEIIKKCNYILTKEFLFPDVERMRMILLIPSPKVALGMPMAYGLEEAKREFGTAESEYYITPRGLEVDKLITALFEVQEKNEPVCVIGATSGFIYLFNICREKGLEFELPEGSRVCDGGGYQGTFGECSRDQYYALVEEFLGVPWHMCVNALGMGESGTNYFDNVLRDFCRGEVVKERHKVDLPWTRTIVVGVRTGKRLPEGELGLIRHYDLTNRATVLAVQTDNIGYETDKGFEILGRTPNLIPGYNVTTPGGTVKDWLLGVGRHVPSPQDVQNDAVLRGHPPGVPAVGCSADTARMIRGGHPCSTAADQMLQQGHPCSAVADQMLRQGHPCSTIADRMLNHGHPCSTTADQMLKHGHPCSAAAEDMLKYGHPCSTVADQMLKQGNPCSTVAEEMLEDGHPRSIEVDGMLENEDIPAPRKRAKS